MWLSDEEYKFMCLHIPIICIDLVVKTEQGLLLTKRDIEPDKGCWHLPGGRVRHKETVHDAIRRVAINELNVFVKNPKLIGYMEILEEIQNGIPRHVVSLIHSVDLVTNNISGSWQAQETCFFPKRPSNVVPGHDKFLINHNIWRI